MVSPPMLSRLPEIFTPTMGRAFDSFGLSGSFVLVVLVALLLGPASAELELRALIDDDVSLRELVLSVLVLALLVPALPGLELLFPDVLLHFAFSLELKSLNFSSIEFCLLFAKLDLCCGKLVGVAH